MFNIFDSFHNNTKTIIVVVLALVLSACGSGGSSDSDSRSTASSSDSNNDAPDVIASVIITSQPATLTINSGMDAVFIVVASGGQLSFQWKKGNDEIAGATSSTLTLLNTTNSNAGEYSVVVTNSSGSLTSLTALLSVNEVVSSIELTWDIPVAREDGSDLELFEINGYVVKYGTISGDLSSQVSIQGATDTSILIESLSAGTYYFSIATIDSEGVHGGYSTQIEQVVL